MTADYTGETFLQRQLRLKRERDAAERPQMFTQPAQITDASGLKDRERYGKVAVAKIAQRIAALPEGVRDDGLNKELFNAGALLRDGTITHEQLADAVLEVIGDDDTWDHYKVREKIQRAPVEGASRRRDVDYGVAAPDLDDWTGILADSQKATDADETTIPTEVTTEPPGDPAAALSALVRKNLPTIDWHALWADETQEEWIVEPLLPIRRLVALYSAPKVGKSLLLLEVAAGVSVGGTVLGVQVEKPRKVLYVDFENDPKADIRERLQAMGYSPEQLGNLHYLSFPTLSALDSEQGGRELMAAVTEYECEVVVIDTVSRSIQGEENENDTWLNFYRHTGMRMKQAGVAMIRLDHSGKDETKGQRGGSAKSGDVDAIWKLSRVTDDTYQLHCDDARMPVTERTLVLHRESNPLRHRVDALGRSAAWSAKIEACIKAMDDAGLDDDAGNVLARQTIRDAGLKAGNDLISEVVKRRSDRSESESERWFR